MPKTMPKSADRPCPADAAGWEHFHHVADVGIRGSGPGPGQAFEQAALAMTAVVSDPGTVSTLETVEFRCEAPNLELLLVDWLNAVIFEMSTRRMLFGSFDVRIDGNVLAGSASGERVDVARHQPAAEVKGATMCELAVGEQPDGSWIAQCIVDV